MNDGVDTSVMDTTVTSRTRQRRPIETCMSFPTGIRNSNIGEANAWHNVWDLKYYQQTEQRDGPKTAEEEENSNKNPRWELRPGTATFNRTAGAGVGTTERIQSLQQGGNRNSYDVFNFIKERTSSGAAGVVGAPTGGIHNDDNNRSATAAASGAEKHLSQAGASADRCLDPTDLRRHVVQGSEVIVGDDGQPQPDGDKVVDLAPST